MTLEPSTTKFPYILVFPQISIVKTFPPFSLVPNANLISGLSSSFIDALDPNNI